MSETESDLVLILPAVAGNVRLGGVNTISPLTAHGVLNPVAPLGDCRGLQRKRRQGPACRRSEGECGAQDIHKLLPLIVVILASRSR